MPSKPVDEWDIETEILPFVSGVEGGNNNWNFWCPLHDDEGSAHKGFSLSRVGKRNLGHCLSPHCRASLEDLCNWIEGGAPESSIKVSVKKKQKAEPKEPKASKKKGMAWWVGKTGIPQDVWESMGTSENGTGVIFEFEDPPVAKYRKPPKEIIWVGTDEWEAPPLWPPPDDELPEHITITEGESDCGTARFCNLPLAFAATKGAAADFPTSMFEELRSRGVSEVTFAGDADKSGTEFAIRGSRQAIAAGLSANVIYLDRVVSSFSGINDLNGVFRYCDTADEFRTLIERATQKVASRHERLEREDIVTLATQETEWILPGLIAPGDKVLLSGPQKSYKTYIELDLARSLVSCTPFLNRPEWRPDNPVNVLLIQEEGSIQAWAKRLMRLELDDEAWARLHTLHRKGIRFTEPDTIDFVLSYCREHEIDLVAFDPLQRMMPGVDENDSSATGLVWDQIMMMQLAMPKLVCMVVHHANKTETLTWESVRGSSRHGGEVDLGLFVQKTDDGVRIGVDGRDIPRYLGTGEAFDARIHISEDDEPPNLKIDATELSVKVNQVQRLVHKNRDSVLIAVSDGCTTVASIASQTDIHENTVRKYLKELVEEGHLEETQHGEGKAKTYATAREGEECEEPEDREGEE